MSIKTWSELSLLRTPNMDSGKGDEEKKRKREIPGPHASGQAYMPTFRTANVDAYVDGGLLSLL
ncbi:hypothetical protein MUCCIDRAFT_113091 [Mucor lusitanicus CBS 277.49]|uniref:Uncharacterized protein n=1 Tax=Mucor lusitanicus CBS 277.49 TaxID=747725 RepID=A0A168JU90_MUCCL|nr:hypothetical protein MUCCIDRAFT_113091 [Mucor lusitanicus CBS 277.49]